MRSWKPQYVALGSGFLELHGQSPTTPVKRRLNLMGAQISLEQRGKGPVVTIAPGDVESKRDPLALAFGSNDDLREWFTELLEQVRAANIAAIKDETRNDSLEMWYRHQKEDFTDMALPVLNEATRVRQHWTGAIAGKHWATETEFTLTDARNGLTWIDSIGMTHEMLFTDVIAVTPIAGTSSDTLPDGTQTPKSHVTIKRVSGGETLHLEFGSADMAERWAEALLMCCRFFHVPRYVTRKSLVKLQRQNTEQRRKLHETIARATERRDQSPAPG